MDCPSCGRGNASDRLECQYCETLLVDVFAAREKDNSEKTDPVSKIGLSESTPAESRTAYGGRFAATQYTGDLPRLFRFGNRYQILEKLGEGGMGRVYKALDLELDRPVALKTIRAEKGLSPEVLTRFKQELVLARKITHKNVVRIYDLGEEEGMKFFTMELVEGRSLRDELKERGRFASKDAIAFLKQMLSGLAEAHSQGVVHRDLKPANVMVDGSGDLRIMDFGIARTADSATMTGTDEMMGTPDYISPEQVKGEHADAQSDLYSLGVILYEMLTGEVPFKGETAISKIVARIQVKPPAPRSICPEIPAFLERIVTKLMEVDPDLRYKTAEEVLQDIEREQVDRSVVLRVRKAATRYRGWIVAACLFASLGIGMWVYWNGAIQEAAPADVTTIAMVPIANLRPSEELDWLEDGIPQMLGTNVAQSRALRPVLDERIHRILRDLGREDDPRFDSETIRVISQMAGSDFTLFGSYAESGGELRVDLTLHETSTGVNVPISVGGSASRVFDIVDELTVRIKEELGAGRWEREPKGATKSVEAFRAYTEGLEALRAGSFQDAIRLFRQAIEEDEDFALAHARLAETHFQRNDLVAAKAAIEGALPLLEDPSLSVVDRYQIEAISARIDEDPRRAVEAYGKLAELYPDDPDIRLSYAGAIETLGENSKAVAEYRRVLELSPDFGAAILGLGRSLVSSGQPEEAIARLRDALEAGRFGDDREAKGMAYSVLGVALRDQGHFEEAIKILEISLEERRRAGDLRGVMATLTNLAVAQRKLGEYERSERLLIEALEIARETHNETMESFALLALGNVYRETGDLHSALESYRSSLAIELERKEHLELGHRLDAIAMVQLRRGQLADASVFLEQARIHLQTAGDQRELGLNKLVEGEIAGEQGRYQDAIEAMMEGTSILQAAGSKQSIAETQKVLARVYANQGRHDESLRAVSRSIVGYRELQMAQESGVSLLELALIGLDLNVVDEVRAILQSSEVKSLESTPARGELHFALGEFHRNTGDPAAAAKHYESVITDARFRDELPKLIRAQIGLGATHMAQGRGDESLRILETAHQDATKLRLRPLQANAALNLAKTYLSMGHIDLAQDHAQEARELAESFDAKPIARSAHLVLSDIARSQGQHQAEKDHRSIARRLERQLLTPRAASSPTQPEERDVIPAEVLRVRQALEAMLKPTRSGTAPQGP